ncbi:MAG TPA: glycosyltransferase family 4 protein, partial [Actinomycetota bacterium]|nr:glycosyltransferase family 4 protein [Actinomycetota bacterium]
WRGVSLRTYRGSLAGSSVLATSITLHRYLRTFGMIDLVLPVSDFVRNKHLEASLFQGRMVVKPNFAEGRTRRIGPGNHFLYAGYLEDSKGVGHLVREWPGGVELVVAGDGPQAGRLDGFDGVTLVGRQDQDDMEQLFKQTRALMVPSRSYESAPRVILEAYSAGVPVIASRIGGIPELVIDGETGLTVDPDDGPGWKAAIARLSRDSESLRMGANAYELWKEKYSPEAGLKNLEDCYRLAIERRAAR